MIAIIDYGLGNLGSVKNAFDKLGVSSVVTSSSDAIQQAKGIIFPGVGSAQAGMKNLKEMGLDKAIISAIKSGKPLLGICLGMQLLFSYSEEGNTNCLNLITGNVKKFSSPSKIPQIGWNQVVMKPEAWNMKPLFKRIKNNSFFYFVNSYYCDPVDTTIVTGETEYGYTFCSVLEKKNIFGVQFHPEKSGENGLQLLKNFVQFAYANNTSN